MKAITFLSLILIACSINLAQSGNSAAGWNGIVPLHSTRADVERRLGVSTDECKCIYRTAKEIIYVDYAKAACKGTIHGWNVPEGTVLQFAVTPVTKPLFSVYGVDETGYVITYESPTTKYYTNVREGIRYAVQNGNVMHIDYIPSSNDAHFRCEGFPAYDGGVTQYRPYVRFTKKTDVDMSAYLDDFASQLAAEDTLVGYIITYAGKVSTKGEAKAVAERARRYLIDRRNITPEKIVPIDGGFRAATEVELYLVPRTMPAPTATPTLSPKEVTIERSKNHR
jgi:hypothetical protein